MKTRSQPTSFSSTLGKQDLMAVQGTRSWHTPDIRVYWEHIKRQWWWNTPWLLIWVRRKSYGSFVYFINHFPEMNQPQLPGVLRPNFTKKFWVDDDFLWNVFPGWGQSPTKICFFSPTFSWWVVQSWNLFGGAVFSSWRKVMQILPWWKSSWWFQPNPSEKYYIVKMGSSSPNFGVKIKDVSNHLPDINNNSTNISKNIRKFSLKWLYVRNFPNPKKATTLQKVRRSVPKTFTKRTNKNELHLYSTYLLASGLREKKIKKPSEESPAVNPIPP